MNFKKKIWLTISLLIIASIGWFIFGRNKITSTSGKDKYDLFFTCDMKGRITPCGCFTGQLGGLTKIKTMINSFQSNNKIILDVGNAISGQEDYHVIQHEFMMKGFQSISYDAINIGQREALLSLPFLLKLKQLSEDNSLPIVSANLRNKSDQKPIFKPYIIITKGLKKFGIIGVVSSQFKIDSLDKNIYIQEPRLALAEHIAELDKQVDVIILLGFLSPLEMNQIASEFFEIDFILGGNVRESSQQIEKENQSWIYYTTNEGRTLGQISFLFDKKVKIENNKISLAYENIHDDEEIEKLSVSYRNKVRNTALAIDSIKINENSIPGVKSQNYFVGSEKCANCHEEDYKKWKATSHAHAFKSLQNKNSDADPSCITCHTIGFGSESGYQRSFKGEKLIDVGCENCHGPAGLHVDEFNTKEKRLFKFNPVTESECRKCHYGEFSRPFEWKSFWQKVKHGKKY
jgi:hypothetical protein